MSSDIRKIVVEALHESVGALDSPDLSPRLKDPAADIRLEELGLDSLTAIEWCMGIESRTGLELDPEVLGRVETLSGLVAHIAGRLPPS